jgi:protein-tyrosine phosphatase
MVQLAAAEGTSDLVATPHANHDYPFSPGQIASKIAELAQATGNILNIHSGCDFHLSAENIQDALAHPAKYAINHRSYLLVEFSEYAIPPAIGEIFERLRGAGIVPIITHPERNRLLHDRAGEIRSWVDDSCLVQVTAQSFLGRFGKGAQAFSNLLMNAGLVHFVASDGHDLKSRPPVLSEAYRYVVKNYGEARAHALFVTNPKATLTGDPVEQLDPEPKQRKWYQFGRSSF